MSDVASRDRISDPCPYPLARLGTRPDPDPVPACVACARGLCYSGDHGSERTSPPPRDFACSVRSEWARYLHNGIASINSECTGMQ